MATLILMENTRLYCLPEHNTTFLLVEWEMDYFCKNIGMVLVTTEPMIPIWLNPLLHYRWGHQPQLIFPLKKQPLIQGTVTDPSGNPVSNASVNIQTGECYGGGRAAQIAWTSTNQDGTYSVPVPPGTDYYVFVSPPASINNPLLFGFWTGPSPAVVSSECNQGVAVPEAVIGNTVENINLQLVEGAVIEGRVTTPSGETDVPVSGAYVMVREITTSDWWPSGSQTDGDGNYRIVLPPGAQYYVQANGGQNNFLLSEYWDGADNNGTDDPSLAQPTALLQVGTPTTVNFSLEKAAMIQGTVTDPSGNPVSNASVSIQKGECIGWSRATHITWTSTNQDGTYSVPVPPGTDYYVFVSPPASINNPLLFGFWTGPSPAVVSSECNQGVAVPEAVIGNTVENINLQLVEGAVIEGRVTTPSGETDAPVSGAYVMVREITTSDWWPSGSQTDGDGNYRIVLPPGAQYYVQANGGQNSFLLSEYWDGADNNGTDDPSLAQPTALLQVGTPTTVNFSLEKAAVIRGTVIDPSGNPVSNASVGIQTGECYGSIRATQVAWTATNQDGTYSVPVPPGADYYVYVSPQASTNNNLLFGFWTGPSPAVVSSECNQGVAVPEAVIGDTVDNINLQLVEGAVIEGTVTTPSGETDAPVSGAYVMVREITNNNFWPYNGFTDIDGKYRIILPPGSQYYVYADGGQNGLFLYELWDGTGNDGTYDFNLAQPTAALQVGIPTTVDFSLDEGVKIIGQVKDENTGEPVDDIVVMATTQRCENYNQIAQGISATVGEQKGYYQLLVRKDMTVYIGTCVHCSSNNDYMDIWYPKVSSEIACENATGVSVPSGSTEVTGIDLLLPTDTDRDGVSDADETNIYGTDPTKSDSDGDGLNDGGEVSLWGNDFNGDIDGDLILNIHETDADNDGVSDRQEFARGSHPDDFKNPDNLLPPLTLYEDFSSPTLDPEKWEVGQYGMEVKDNALQMFAHAPNSKKVYARLHTTVDENLKTTFMITDLAKNTSDSQWLYYSNLGVYYSENIDPDQLTGRVVSTIYVGDRGNGLEAWYWIGRTLNENEDTEDYKVGVLLPAGSPLLALNTQYNMEIRYDGNNGFTYTLLNAAGTILGQVVDTGPTFVSSIDKHLSAKVKTPDSGGKISVVIDKVETSAGANPYTIYDTFDGASLDSTKWNEPEIAKEITPEGKLRMLAHSFGDKRTTAATLKKRFNYVETRVVLDQAGIVSAPSTTGRARLAMTLYNDTYGPDPNSNPVIGLPHQGYEGNIWGSVYIDYIEGRGLVAKAYAERAEDPKWDTYKELFWQELDIELQFGVEYILSIGFSNNIMVFAIDSADGSQHAMAGDTIATPKYLPFNPDTQLITRVYGNNSEARQMAYFDDVRVSGEPLEKAGDVNVDGAVNLEDAILTLQAMTGMKDIPVWSTGDVNGDHLIGLPEIIEIMNSL